MAKKTVSKVVQDVEEVKVNPPPQQPKINPTIARYEKELREIAAKLREAKNHGTQGELSALLKRQGWLLEQRDNEL